MEEKIVDELVETGVDTVEEAVASSFSGKSFLIGVGATLATVLVVKYLPKAIRGVKNLAQRKKNQVVATENNSEAQE